MHNLLKSYRSLITALAFLIAMIAARMIWYGTFHFAFLLWNIFLAILPLLFSHFVAGTKHRALSWLCAGCWLLFFPNSAYLLTDVVHLRIRQGTGFWLDMTILFSAGFFGVIVALMSLRKMEAWYGRMLSKQKTLLLTFALLLLNGYGIYLGRVERWNSWDILCNTGDLMGSIAYEVRHPFRCIEVWGLSGIFASALCICYFGLSGKTDPGQPG